MRRRVIRGAKRLLFIDETGINLSMTRAYARAPLGERACDAVLKNWGDNVTVTAALTLEGIVAPMMLHGAMNGRAFEAYVEQCLAPELRCGDVVVLDKLGAHKAECVRALVEARGARLVFLPSYSPDFNPIEHAWSKLKARLRKDAPQARTCTSFRPPRHHTQRLARLVFKLRLPRSMFLRTALDQKRMLFPEPCDRLVRSGCDCPRSQCIIRLTELLEHSRLQCRETRHLICGDPLRGCLCSKRRKQAATPLLLLGLALIFNLRHEVPTL